MYNNSEGSDGELHEYGNGVAGVLALAGDQLTKSGLSRSDSVVRHRHRELNSADEHFCANVLRIYTISLISFSFLWTLSSGGLTSIRKGTV